MRSLSMVGLVGVALVAVSCQDDRTPTAVSDHSIQLSSSSGGGDALWEFDELVGVPRPFTGPVNAIRGVRGGGLPWVIDEGEARLDEDGELRVKVEGLVLDPNDPAVIARGLAGNNPVGAFKAILSCLTVDANGNAATVNLATATSPATTGVGGGDAESRGRSGRRRDSGNARRNSRPVYCAGSLCDIPGWELVCRRRPRV